MTTLYKADDRNLLRSVLNANGIHLGPGAVIDGLTAEQAHARPHGLPHSIAEIVAHMCYWQIVTMRQVMGLWPPPAGSITW
jgi:hypothetical protein